MPSKAGPEARQVRRMSRQIVVALPPWVRRRLGVESGATVYWFRHRVGEVVLTAKGDRVQGAPGRRDLEEELARVMAERDEFKRQALALDAGERRHVFGQGYEQGVKSVPIWRAEVGWLRDEVRTLAAEVHLLTRRARDRGPRRPRPAPASHVEAERDPPFADDFDAEGRVKPRGVETIPLPDLPSPSVESTGEPDTSGAEPPGVPQES